MSFFNSSSIAQASQPVISAARDPEPAPQFSSKYRHMKIKELREKKTALAAEVQSHLDANEAAWSSEHEAKHQEMMSDLGAMTSMIQTREGAGEHLDITPGAKSGYSVLVDASGNRHFAVSKGQKLSSVPAVASNMPTDCEHPAGEFLRAIVTGVNSSTPPSIAAAMDRGVATSGGFLLSSNLAAGVVDKARAKSIIMNSGATLISLTGADLAIAQLVEDPAMQAKIENDKFAESSITLGKTVINPRLVGCLVRASREMVEDASNCAALIEQTLHRALAASIDRLGVDGSGVGQEPIGIINMAGIEETDTVGAIDWTKLASAAKEVRLNDHEPNAVIMNTAIAHSLGMQADDQGRWLGAPPPLSNVLGLDSTHVPSGKIVVGDFANFCLALRQGAVVEVSEQGGGAFENHQILFKIFWRGDFCCLDRSAFRIMSGVTAE